MNENSKDYQKFLVEIRKAIEDQYELYEKLHEEWEYVMYQKRQQMILVKNFTFALHYLANDATEDEFVRLSEIFGEIAKETQSLEFIRMIEKRLAKVKVKSNYIVVIRGLMYAKGWMGNFQTVLNYRINEDENNYWVDDFWKKEVLIFTEDINTTIRFIRSECNDEQFYYMSEVFEEIAQKTQSHEFIHALEERVKSVADLSEAEEISQEIEYAKGQIND